MFVLTASQNSFTTFQSKLQVRKSYKFILNLSDIYGLHGQNVIILRDACQRPDYSSIKDYCKTSGWNIQYK